MQNNARIVNAPEWVERFAACLGVEGADDWPERSVHIQAFGGADARAGFTLTLMGSPPRFVVTLLLGYVNTQATSIKLLSEGRELFAGPFGDAQEVDAWELLTELLSTQGLMVRPNDRIEDARAFLAGNPVNADLPRGNPAMRIHHATVLLLGHFGLSIEQAYGVVAEWNTRTCQYCRAQVRAVMDRAAKGMAPHGGCPSASAKRYDK